MTARGRRRPRDVRIDLPIVLTAVPDRRRRPSDGLVVEASIVARLLRLRILTLHAAVVVTPAEVTAPGSRGARTRAPALPRASAPALPRAMPPPRRAGAAGHGLAEAVRQLDEAAAILADGRRDGARAAR